MPLAFRPCRRFLPLPSCSCIVSLITLLLLGSEPAYAEWVEVVGSVEEGPTASTVYVDLDTVVRSGDTVKVWVLSDFKTTQIEPKPPHMSVKSQREFDCTKQLMRLLTVTAFSGNMGSGRMVYSSSNFEGQGSILEPGSVTQRLWKVACKK